MSTKYNHVFTTSSN